MKRQRHAAAIMMSAALLSGSAISWASNQQQPGKGAGAPDLTQACAKECPNVATQDEALKCVDKMEESQGEAAFKKQHHACHKAHEKYEKWMGQQESHESEKAQG